MAVVANEIPAELIFVKLCIVAEVLASKLIKYVNKLTEFEMHTGCIK